MPEQTERRIVQEMMDEPHVKGRRISVLQLRDRVEERGLEPRTVASRYELDVADVYRALAYYHEHPEEMQQIRERHEEIYETVEQEAREHRPDDVTPPNDDE